MYTFLNETDVYDDASGKVVKYKDGMSPCTLYLSNKRTISSAIVSASVKIDGKWRFTDSMNSLMFVCNKRKHYFHKMFSLDDYMEDYHQVSIVLDGKIIDTYTETGSERFVKPSNCWDDGVFFEGYISDVLISEKKYNIYISRDLCMIFDDRMFVDEICRLESLSEDKVAVVEKVYWRSKDD